MIIQIRDVHRVRCSRDQEGGGGEREGGALRRDEWKNWRGKVRRVIGNLCTGRTSVALSTAALIACSTRAIIGNSSGGSYRSLVLAGRFQCLINGATLYQSLVSVGHTGWR